MKHQTGKAMKPLLVALTYLILPLLYQISPASFDD